MSDEPEKNEDVFSQKEEFVQRPLWLRVVLFLMLVVLVGVAFYFANLGIINRFENR